MGPNKVSKKANKATVVVSTSKHPRENSAITFEEFVYPLLPRESKGASWSQFFTKIGECTAGTRKLLPNCLAPFIMGVNALVNGRCVLLTRWKGANDTLSTNFNGVLFEYTPLGELLLMSNHPRALVPFNTGCHHLNVEAYNVYDGYDGTCVTVYYNRLEKAWRIMTATSEMADNNKYFGPNTLHDVVFQFDQVKQLITPDSPTDICYSFIVSHPDWNPALTQANIYPVQSTNLTTGKVTSTATNVSGASIFQAGGLAKYTQKVSNEPISETCFQPNKRTTICLRAKTGSLYHPDFVIYTPYMRQIQDLFYMDGSRDLATVMVVAYLKSNECPLVKQLYPVMCNKINGLLSDITNLVIQYSRGNDLTTMPIENARLETVVLINETVKLLVTALGWRTDIAPTNNNIAQEMIRQELYLNHKILHNLCSLCGPEHLNLISLA